MGVWIETREMLCGDSNFYVTPCMGVWIETNPTPAGGLGTDVTPCMGVWIETQESEESQESQEVTPCMGVWIETLTYSPKFKRNLSHPVWVCGLKPYNAVMQKLYEGHTLYGCVD